MEDWLQRTELLIGKKNLEQLRYSTVVVFGCGGVGSFVVEGLVRAGIGNLVLFDPDIISITNLNRQIMATVQTIGESKVQILKQRALQINPALNIRVYSEFVTEENIDSYLRTIPTITYLVDAVDIVSSKLAIIQYAHDHKIPLISCMGTGNKIDPTRFEITDIGLIKKAAMTGKPVIMSTGIATAEDIELAIRTCKEAGNENILLMKCTSSYPAPINAANLSMIPDMKARFSCRVGLSDHSLGSVVASTAVALGAEMVEKHFILDRRLGGPDAAFSMEPDEFKEMVKRIRDVEKSLGKVDYNLSESAIKNRHFSKSLFVIADVKKGEFVTKDNVRAIRPGDGLHPRFYEEILGKTFSQNIEKGTPLALDMLI